MTLTPNETAAILWLTASLVAVVIFLVLAIWRSMYTKLDGMEKAMNASTVNQAVTQKEIEHIDGRVTNIESRVSVVEKKLNGFAA